MSRDRWSRALRWPLWSWRHLAVTSAVALALLAGVGRLTHAVSSAEVTHPSAGSQSSAPASSATSGPVVPPPPAAAPPATTPSSGASAPSTPPRTGSAVDVATAFVTAWLTNHGGSARWLAAMGRWATPTLLASLAQTDPSQVPATRVTGDAALTSMNGPAASVSVPTDGGRVAVHLVERSARWWANELAPDDAAPGAPTPTMTGPASTTSTSGG